MTPKSLLLRVDEAIKAIGLGYDITSDIRLKHCKDSSNSSLIELDDTEIHSVVLPGGLTISGVPKSIKYDKGERIRFKSDVLSFQQAWIYEHFPTTRLPHNLQYNVGEPLAMRWSQQAHAGASLGGVQAYREWLDSLNPNDMSEQFNQELSLSGKIPSGFFNNMFDFTGCWQKDAANTKTLAFDGWFITLYAFALSKSQIVLLDHVKHEVPSTWDPAALARFIERFGTHIIIGVKMGGKDVIYIRQQHSSDLQHFEVQKRLKNLADMRFQETSREYDMASKETYGKDKFEMREQPLRFLNIGPSSSNCTKEGIVIIPKRRGGKDTWDLSHNEWLNSVHSEPDVISMSFLPITSLLNGVPGSGFLNHAINLYLRYKPPIEELHQFLEFQLPRQWAPVYCDLPLGPQQRKQSSASLQFAFMGPKLYVNTSVVDVRKKPVTGLRLYLEGKRSNRLAIHLQHLCALPQIFQLCDSCHFSVDSHDRKYYEPVSWQHFSHVCTAPVEPDDDLSIITGAQLHVEYHGLKKVLFLRLQFSSVSNAALVKNSEWEGSPNLAQKSGLISTLISTHFSMVSQKPPPRPADVNINSAVYPGGPPVQTPKLLKFVDTTEMSRGPQDSPGYWVVSGAKLHLERGKISLRVKYSLLTAMLPDEEF